MTRSGILFRLVIPMVVMTAIMFMFVRVGDGYGNALLSCIGATRERVQTHHIEPEEKKGHKLFHGFIESQFYELAKEFEFRHDRLRL